MSADPTHPLHAASVYVEDVKYRPGEPHELAAVSYSELLGWLERIIDAAGLGRVDTVDLLDSLAAPAEQLAAAGGQSHEWALAIVTDGVLHGLALAAGLHGPPPATLQTPAAPTLIVFRGGIAVHAPAQSVAHVDPDVVATALAAAKLTDLNAEQTAEALEFYGQSYAHLLGVEAQWAADTFLAGFLRGVHAAADPGS